MVNKRGFLKKAPDTKHYSDASTVEPHSGDTDENTHMRLMNMFDLMYSHFLCLRRKRRFVIINVSFMLPSSPSSFWTVSLALV